MEKEEEEREEHCLQRQSQSQSQCEREDSLFLSSWILGFDVRLSFWCLASLWKMRFFWDLFIERERERPLETCDLGSDGSISLIAIIFAYVDFLCVFVGSSLFARRHPFSTSHTLLYSCLVWDSYISMRTKTYEVILSLHPLKKVVFASPKPNSLEDIYWTLTQMLGTWFSYPLYVFIDSIMQDIPRDNIQALKMMWKKYVRSCQTTFQVYWNLQKLIRKKKTFFPID